MSLLSQIFLRPTSEIPSSAAAPLSIFSQTRSYKAFLDTESLAIRSSVSVVLSSMVVKNHQTEKISTPHVKTAVHFFMNRRPVWGSYQSKI